MVRPKVARCVCGPLDNILECSDQKVLVASPIAQEVVFTNMALTIQTVAWKRLMYGN